MRKGRHHGLVLGAAGLAMLLAATVLAALATLTEQTVLGAARQRLAADRDAVISVGGPYAPGKEQAYEQTGAAVRRALDGAYGGVPQQTYDALRVPENRATELSVADADGRVRGDVTVALAALEGLREHAETVSGRLPGPRPDGTVEAALSQPLAAELRVRPGDRLTVLTSADTELAVEVTGIYRPRAEAAALWGSQTGSFGGTDSLAVVPLTTVTGTPELAGDSVRSWLAVPDAGRFRLDDIDGLSDRAAAFSDSDPARSLFGGQVPPEARDLEIDSGLGPALDRLRTPIAVSRAGMYIPASLLAALALATLVLTARQLATHQRAELALLAARGAGTWRLAAGAAGQWAVLAVPAGIAAPFLAGPLLGLLPRVGLAEGDLPGTALIAAGWTAAALAVVVHGVAVLVPVVRSVRDRRAVSRLRWRPARFAAAQRLGADVVLAAVAVLGWLQLRQYRSPVGSASTVDLVLVFAPVMMTAAAAVLVLRLLPPAARLFDPLAQRGTGFVLPFGGWQLGRRAAGHAAAALVVTLALAVAALSSTALVILDRGDQDQASFQVGSDLRIDPSDRLADDRRRDAYAQSPGIRAVTPVTEVDASVAQQSVGVTAVNTGSGALTDHAGPKAAHLGEGIPEHGLRLVGSPKELTLRVRLSADGPGKAHPVLLTGYFEDGDGLVHGREVELREGGPVTVRLPVPPHTTHLVQLGLTMPYEVERRTYRLVVDEADELDRPGRWRDLFLPAPDLHVAGCPGAEPRKRPGEAPGPVLCSSGPERPGVLIDGVLRGPNTALVFPVRSIRLGFKGPKRPPAAPALADATLIDDGLAVVGDTVTVRQAVGGSARLKIVGTIEAIPGDEARDQPNLLVDSRAFAAQLLLSGGTPGVETFWWARADDGDARAAALAVRATPRLGKAIDVATAREALAADPLRRGTRAALALCLALAPPFAVVAFTLHTVLAARSRSREFALLRAIGVRKRQLAAFLWTEQLGLAAVAAVLGTLLGAGLAVLIMPVVTVEADARPVFPDLATEVPWMRVVVTAAVTTALICAVVTVAARSLGRVDLARVLRAGDDV
ncbi:ABC transporter permease [Streptomyces sp. TRM66268-LWL]|uniref:ABC transporter permease n=1 Tax=Streptomyces polyasparticus TaxID=2767826 RepID=A0ABR7SCP0_9ACTN|nr:ABC transporter permease [Streptomyces polyasparticus]MBC9713251.1 ABC transporter permease [Streptomyces polyasparticus]